MTSGKMRILAAVLALIVGIILPSFAASMKVSGITIEGVTFRASPKLAGMPTGAMIELYAAGFASDTWFDASGNGNDFGQATATKCPIASDGYVYFDGTDDSLYNNNLSQEIASGAHTFIVLFKRDTGGATDQVLFSGNATHTYLIDHNVSGNITLFTGAGWYDAGTSAIGTGTKFFAVSICGGNSQRVYNSIHSHSVSMPGSIGTKDLIIGELWGLSGSFFKGRIYALLVYPRRLTSDEIDKALATLIDNYGVTLN